VKLIVVLLENNNQMLNRIKGMVIGGAVGDSLGSRYEFRYQINQCYNGLIDTNTTILRRFQGALLLELGQVTDDTEMALTLGRCMIKEGGYYKDRVIIQYLEWANSGMSMMGRNTRALLKGVTTLAGYHGRHKKTFQGTQDGWTQSNGSLMRCYPLALLSDQTKWTEDCQITNPHQNNIDAQSIYLYVLHWTLKGYSKEQLATAILEYTREPVRSTILSAYNKVPQNLAQNKGWVLNALYAALYCFFHFDSFQEAMQWIIDENRGSDTDTNAAIAGSLLGARLGFDALQQETNTAKNISVVLAYTGKQGDLPRPPKYTLFDFESYCQALSEIESQKK
jgi:ADP-ribosyl-[dinitrogen reductase] hydrolase